MHLYTFWEGRTPPLYLELCVETWQRHIPNLEVELINYGNLHKYVGQYVDISKLKTFSLAMQSDVISAVVLAKRGGTFIDIDTIMLPNVRLDFLASTNSKINVFGIPKTGAFHVALMSTTAGNPAALHWMNEASKRVDLSPTSYPWNYLAGDILEKLTIDPEYSEYFNIVDRNSSGNILESAWSKKYRDFYFSEGSENLSAEIALSRARYGIVSLHNSWTPSDYSALDNRKDLLNMDYLLSRILKHSLAH
ncbi:hypothetical protein ACTXO0_16645 [Glutamicibacter ardleyensis]|uniref:hypothetical protein n=1 Tax=Glutamicibacter ardleyensis TaxID=225894 RepID=UPI003FD39FD4